ncbi:MAG: hypothetical protein K6A80_01660 [Saccharofermentans sp.]|nr:hypothetical protein [Saccharofermentans sp.]
MLLVIDIPNDIYKDILEINTIIGHLGSVDWSIRNGKPYDEIIDKVTDLIETEWGYEGIREDVARIMKGK